MAVGVVDVTKEVEVGHDQRQRAVEPDGAAELLRQRRGEVARVEKAGLRIDAGLLLERGHREGAVDQQHRGDPDREQPGVQAPEADEREAEQADDQLVREALEREQAALAQVHAAREPEHHRDDRVVEGDVDECRRDTRERPDLLLGARSVIEHEVRDRPGREEVDRVVRDVERLHEPRVPNPQPLRQVHDDRHQCDQLGRQQEDRREHEHDRRRERVVLERVDREELGHGRGGAEEDEEQPALGVRRELREAGHDRRSRDEKQASKEDLRAQVELLVLLCRHRLPLSAFRRETARALLATPSPNVGRSGSAGIPPPGDGAPAPPSG